MILKIINNNVALCLTIFIFAFFVRIFYLYVIDGFSMMPIEDALDYYKYSQNLIKDGDFVLYSNGEAYYSGRDPLLPYLLFITSLLFGNTLENFYVFMAIVSSAVVPVIFLIAKQFTNGFILPLLIAFSFIFYPPAVFYSSKILTETLAILFISLSFLFTLKAVSKNNLKFYVLAGIFFGVSSLTRANLFYLSFFLVILLFFFSICINKDSKISLKGLAVMLLANILIVSPWTYRNFQIYDEFVLVNSRMGYGLYLCNNDPLSDEIKSGSYKRFEIPQIINDAKNQGMNEIQINSIYQDLAKNQIINNLTSYPEIFVNRSISYLHYKPSAHKHDHDIVDYVMLIIWMPIIIGFMLSIGRYRDVRYYVGWLFFVYGLITILPFWGTPRFRFPYDGIIIVLSLIHLSRLILRKKINEK